MLREAGMPGGLLILEKSHSGESGAAAGNALEPPQAARHPAEEQRCQHRASVPGVGTCLQYFQAAVACVHRSLNI